MKGYKRIAIIGSGISGLLCSYALAKKDAQIFLIDNNDFRTANSQDRRAIVLSVSSKFILEHIGLWKNISYFCTPITEVWISEKKAFGRVRLKAEEAGLEALGWSICAQDLLMVISKSVLGNANITLKMKYLFEDFSTSKKALFLRPANRPIEVLNDIDLVVGADGVNSSVRKKMGLILNKKNFNQDAIVGHVFTSKSNNGIAIQKIFNLGSLALIPSGRNRFTFIFIVKKGCMKSYGRNYQAYLDLINHLCGSDFGSYCFSDSPRIFPVYGSKVFYKHSDFFALVGNSRGTVHPSTAQGLNLGIRDIDELMIRLSKENRCFKTFGPKILSHYFTKRDLTEVFASSVATLYQKRNPISNILRRSTLASVAINKPFRRLITRLGTGLSYIDQ